MKRISLILIFLLLLGALAACGGDGDGDDPSTASLSFTGNDSFEFDPATASVPAGAETTVEFENVGTLEHSWVLVGSDADAATVTDADAIGNASSGTVPAGEQTSFTFTAPDAGTYQYVCTVPGHAAAGMVGTLTVSDN